MYNHLASLPTQLSLGLLSLSLIISSPANAQLIKQEFDGTFELDTVSDILASTTPSSVDYSGFVLFDTDGNLEDFAIIIEDLDIDLNPESTSPFADFSLDDSDLGLDDPVLTLDLGPDLDSIFLPPSPPPTIGFDLVSLLEWDLSIDFGIAFDAPLFTLDRDDSTLTFGAALGLAGGFTFEDTDANFTETTVTPVPESSTLLGLGFVTLIGIAKFKGKVKKIN